MPTDFVQSKLTAATGTLRVRLASGVRLAGGAQSQDALILMCPGGNVQLNQSAVAILRKCDGSRSRQNIIAELMHCSDWSSLAKEIGEFLEAARALGWIVEE